MKVYNYCNVWENGSPEGKPLPYIHREIHFLRSGDFIVSLLSNWLMIEKFTHIQEHYIFQTNDVDSQNETGSTPRKTRTRTLLRFSCSQHAKYIDLKTIYVCLITHNFQHSNKSIWLMVLSIKQLLTTIQPILILSKQTTATYYLSFHVRYLCSSHLTFPLISNTSFLSKITIIFTYDLLNSTFWFVNRHDNSVTFLPT